LFLVLKKILLNTDAIQTEILRNICLGFL
jgi:hypothetical protein